MPFPSVAPLALAAILAAPAPALPEAVVGVRANRGFQGLFEWAPGSDGIAPDKALGGPWITSGTVLDLPAIANDLEIAPTLRPGPRDLFILTNLRSVHNARSIWVRRSYDAGGPIPAVEEVAATVVAQDGAVNLALLRATLPPGSRPPRGVRLAAEDVKTPGAEVLQVHVWEWRTYVFPDTIWRIGLNDVGGDPFWFGALPAYGLFQSVFVNRSGDPLIDPATGRLVGLVAHGLRGARDRGRDSWRGPAYGIPVGRIRDFLSAALRGAEPVHGSIGPRGPMLLGIGPDLSRLLGLSSAQGYLVTADWKPQEVPILREGDVILKAAGRRLGAGGTTLEHVAFDAAPGTAVTVDGTRDGAPFRVEIPIVPLGDRTSAAVRHTSFAGAWFQDLAPVFTDPLDDTDGVLVAFVEDGSAAQAAGLDFRSVVKEVFGSGTVRSIHGVADLESALREIVSAPSFSGEIGVRVVDLRLPNVGVEANVIRIDAAAAREAIAAFDRGEAR